MVKASVGVLYQTPGCANRSALHTRRWVANIEIFILENSNLRDSQA